MSIYINDRPVMELFELLANTGSSLAKKEIIRENSENERFLLYINYLLNPFLVTGISEKKISKETDKLPTRSFDSFRELMEYILQNNTGVAQSRGFSLHKPLGAVSVFFEEKISFMVFDSNGVTKASSACFE